MQKRQSLFSEVFCFRNPTQKIFSELYETKAKPPILPRRTQNTEGETERGQGGPTPPGGAAKRGGAPSYGVGPSGPLRRRPFAYIILQMRKPLNNPTIFHEEFRSRRHREDKFRGTEVSVPARRRDVELPPESSPSTPPPSSSPLLSPMMRRE